MENRWRNRMAGSERAKQFLPFDALRGFREELKDREQVFEPKRELSEEQMEEIDRKLRQIGKGDVVTIEYYREGNYEYATGTVTAIDKENEKIMLVRGEIPFQDIADIQCSRFE